MTKSRPHRAMQERDVFLRRWLPGSGQPPTQKNLPQTVLFQGWGTETNCRPVFGRLRANCLLYAYCFLVKRCGRESQYEIISISQELTALRNKVAQIHDTREWQDDRMLGGKTNLLLCFKDSSCLYTGGEI